MLAEGRDTEIVDLGGGRVLRRPKAARDLSGELVAMEAAAAAGFPTVRVHGLQDGGLVLDRLDGTDMLADLGRHPIRLRRHARLLADLHRRLAAVTAPAEMDEVVGPDPAAGSGTSLLHLDLHPGNVMLTDRGPIVIDWTNARRGPGPVDVANTWLLLACADAPSAGWLDRTVVRGGRRIFLAAFLRAAGRSEAARHLDVALANQHERNLNLSPAEAAAMDAEARRHHR